MICPVCPKDERIRISFFSSATSVRCNKCRTNYRALTQIVADTTRQRPAMGGRRGYRVTTKDSGGHVAHHRFEAPAGLKALSGQRISIISRRGRIIGIANQATETWYPVPNRSLGQVSTLAQLGGVVAALAIAIYLAVVSVISLGSEAISGLGGPALMILAILVLLSPLADGLRADAARPKSD